MSKFVAVLAWLSFFGLAWGLLLNERLQNGQAVIALCFFLILALTSSGMTPNEKESKK